jgi:tRNA(Arg) A34 adenosine deaminase TadA
MTDQEAMRLAISVCREGIRAAQSPFGCVIVVEGSVVAASHNSVRRDLDPTAHAEINAIRDAAHALATIDLSHATLYTTCEPCPMCLAASHWARVSRVVFGASIADAESSGFREMPIPALTLASMGKAQMQFDAGVLRDECVSLFAEWKAAGHATPY